MHVASTPDSPRTGAPESPWRVVAIGVALFGVALALGLYRIGHKSVWYDEAVSISYAHMPIEGAWRAIAGRDSNGALYYAILWAWVHLVGIGEGAVRALSAVFAAASVPFLFLVGRRLFGTGVGVAAAALLCVQGFFIEYAQEARSYALAMLLATVATWLLLRAMDDRRRLGWIWYALALAAGVYAHLFVVLVGAAHAAWVLAFRRREVARLWPAWALAAALSAPLLLALALRPGPLWMSMLTVDSARYVVTELVSGGWPIVDLFEALVVVALVVAVTRRDAGIGLGLAWLLVPVLAMLAVAAARPLVAPRYVLVSLPALALTATAAALALRPAWLRASLYGLLVGASLFGAVSWYAGEPKPNWRSASLYISERATAGDAVVFYPPIVRTPFAYYVERLDLASPALPGPDPATAPTVWLVMNYLPRAGDPAELAAVTRTLAATHEPAGEPINFANVRVQKWVLRP